MPRWVRVDLNYAQKCKTHRRQRYVPINVRIADYCYDFIADERLNAGNYGRNPLPEDANEIYEARGPLFDYFTIDAFIFSVKTYIIVSQSLLILW